MPPLSSPGNRLEIQPGWRTPLTLLIYRQLRQLGPQSSWYRWWQALRRFPSLSRWLWTGGIRGRACRSDPAPVWLVRIRIPPLLTDVRAMTCPILTAPVLKLTVLYPSFSILSWCRLQKDVKRIGTLSPALHVVLARVRTLLVAQQSFPKLLPPGCLIPLVGPEGTRLTPIVHPKVPRTPVRQRTMAPGPICLSRPVQKLRRLAVPSLISPTSRPWKQGMTTRLITFRQSVQAASRTASPAILSYPSTKLVKRTLLLKWTLVIAIGGTKPS